MYVSTNVCTFLRARVWAQRHATLTGKQLPLARWLPHVLQMHILIAFPFLAWLVVADLHACAIYALEEGMAAHSSTVAWRIPTDRGARRATVYGVAERRPQQKRLSTHTPYKQGLPSWLRGKDRLPSRRRELDPWVRKTPLEKEVAARSVVPRSRNPTKHHRSRGWMQKQRGTLSQARAGTLCTRRRRSPPWKRRIAFILCSRGSGKGSLRGLVNSYCAAEEAGREAEGDWLILQLRASCLLLIGGLE